MSSFIEDNYQGKGMEEKYRIIVENSPHFMAEISENGEFLDVNLKMAESLGMSKEEIIGRNLSEIMPQKIAKKRLEKGRKAIKEGRPQVFEDSREGRWFHNVVFSVPKRGSFVVCVRDITHLKKAEKKLKESEKILKMILENLTTGVYIFQDKKFVFVNKAMEKLTGYTRRELLSINYLKLVDPSYREEMERLTNRVIEANTKNIPLRPEFIGLRKNGEKVWVENIPTVIKYNGKTAILGNLVDITDKRIMEEKIKNLGTFYRRLGRAVNLSANLDTLCRRILNTLKDIIAYDMADILIYKKEKNALVLLVQVGYPDDLKEKTIREQKVEGKELKVAAFSALKRKPIYIENMKEHPLTGYVHSLCKKYNISQMYTLPLISQDKLEGVLQVVVKEPKTLSREDRSLLDAVSEEIAAGIAKIKAEEKLRELTQKDYLTGLYNYQHLWQKVEEEEERGKRYGEVYSAIYLDIDNFKAYNDTYGHLEGDRVLKKLGEILKSSLRKSDSAYRYGGEEFVILLPHTKKEMARTVAERIKDRVCKNLSFARITVSMGVTDSDTSENVVRTADEAMYEAKREGKNKIKVI
ncbi:diguanylate cyclase [Candidatus Aerophobetes bacterium]|nr:diguanylate cyclase [Candidatus Aerophobetes bacterium]